jgi:hypothetical protein
MYNCLPEDEPRGFETCRRQQKLKININLENCAFRWFVLCNCITMHFAKSIKLYMQRVSQELDYRIDICRVTKGAHIEHL